MVYCGKPSRGCQMCRTRRIKCDETKPTCLQCQKSRRQCPGYKDDFDLFFRNETQATERRARRAVNKRINTPITFAAQKSAFPSMNSDGSKKESPIQIAPNSDSDMQRALAPLVALSVPVDVQAPCYFMSNFVMAQSQSTGKGSTGPGYFEFVMPLMKSESPDSHFSLAFSAVALASLAKMPNARGTPLFIEAVGQYTKALKAINIALQTPAHQKTDQTLAAILMLGFFETIASERTNAMAWYSHVDGAVQLVKMRGKKQLRTKIGHSLFCCVRTQMTITCMSGSKAPSLGAEWWFSDNIQGDDRVGNFIPRLNLRVAELRAEINTALTSYPRTPEYSQEVLGLLRRAQAMESEYLAFEKTLPDHLRPKTCAWVDHVPGGDISKAEICPGKVDMFEDVFIADMWNKARVARLFISGVVVRCAAWVCSPVDYRTTPEYATAVRLCVDLVTDIIASIPYHLGWRVNESGALRAGDFSSFATGTNGFTNPKALGGFFCIWPLFAVTNTDFVSDSQRQWAKGRLMFISETFGLNHAKVLSNFALRLPSMAIRRDAMVHLPASSQAALSAAYARCASASPAADPNPHITTITINSIAASSASVGCGAVVPQQPQNQVYALDPLHQREQMQRETWERERKKLLKKASNSQGDSVERLLANFLVV